MPDTYHWQIWCETEEAWVYTWSSSKPTECPNNPAHTIDPDKTAITEHAIEDELTGVRGAYLEMQVNSNRRDLYNDEENPLYHESVIPILGNEGHLVNHANRINNLEIIHGKAGWHQQQLVEQGWSRPDGLLIYYGYPNSYNSALNGWDNEKVAQDMARFRLVVLGDGVQQPTHPDYSNTEIIIPRVKALNPNTKIFGYVSVNQALADFQTKVNLWDDLEVHGIFMDEAGYDFGKTRDEFNDRVDYVHGKTYSKLCFANAWNLDHILGTTNDPSYPNTTFNSDLDPSKLDANDWALLESFAVNTLSYTGDYESQSQWEARVSKMISLRASFNVNMAGVAVIGDGETNGQDMFDFAFIAAMMACLEGFGSSDENYGASDAQVKYWTRPNTSRVGRTWTLNPSIQSNSNVNMRYAEKAKYWLDFTSSSEDSGIDQL